MFGNARREGRHFYFHVPRKMRDIGDIVSKIVRITLLRFRYQWPKDPMNDKSATVSQSQGRHKHPGEITGNSNVCLVTIKEDIKTCVTGPL